MEPKKFDVLLDIKRSQKNEYFEATQGDLDTNVINIALQNDFNHYNLTGTTVEISFAKSDGTTVVQDSTTGVTIEDAPNGKIKCILKTNTIACPGKVRAEVRVKEGGKLLTSTSFEFFVKKAIFGDDTIKSSNEWPLLSQLLVAAESEAGRVEAEGVRESNESLRVNEFNQIKSDYTTKTQEVVTATNNANQAATNANSKAELAQTTATALNATNETVKTQEAARVVAEQARKTAFDQMQHVDANLELANARKTFANLGARLDDTDNKLAEDKLSTLTTDAAVTTLAGAVDGVMTLDKIEGNTLQNLCVKFNKAMYRADKDDFVVYKDILKTPNIPNLKPNTTYTVISKRPVAIDIFSGSTWQSSKASITNINIFTLSATQDGITIVCKKSSGWIDEADCINGQFILLEGDYTNKPLPQYFEGIKHLDSCVIKSVGKNLFDGEMELGTISSTTGNLVAHNIHSRSKNFISLQPGKTYRLTQDGISKTGNICFYDKNKNFVQYGSSLSIIPMPLNAHYIKFFYGLNFENTSKLQIVEGSEITPYEPYKEDKIDLTQYINSDEKALKRLPNGTADAITNGGVLTRRIGKIQLTGEETWAIVTSSDGTRQHIYSTNYKNLGKAEPAQALVCNNFPNYRGSWGTAPFATVGTSSSTNFQIGFTFEPGRYTIETFKDFLRANPTTVYYELAAYVTETIQGLTTLKSFKGGSLVVESPIPNNVTVKYPTNLSSRVQNTENELDRTSESLYKAWLITIGLADKQLRMANIQLLTTETNTDLKNKLNEILTIWR